MIHLASANLDLRHWGKWLLRPDYRRQHNQLAKVLALPRYTPGQTHLLSRPLHFADSASFYFMYQEIFQRQIYRFSSAQPDPLIIDGGANIGLSVLYFKQLYPQSRIVAFEPDPEIFALLEQNLANHGITDIHLVPKALWSATTTLDLLSEGADANRLATFDLPEMAVRSRRSVPTVRLRDYLHQPVDFLKLDIEGAETEVLQDCRDLLTQVKHCFIEYHSFVDRPQTLPDILMGLTQAGFRFHLHAAGLSPQPLWQRQTYLDMDMMVNIFAFREAFHD